LGPAILIVGYPALVKALVPESAFVTSAGILLTVLLTRGPFLVPLAVVQPAVVARARRGAAQLVPLVGAVLAAGVLGGIAAAAAGPPLLSMLGDEYEVSGWLVALLVFDASLLASMMLIAALRLAEGRRRRYVTAWGAGVLVALAFLLFPLSLDLRIGLGLLASPLVGTLVLMVPRVRGGAGATSSHGGEVPSAAAG
jgi:hypothetical protein